MGVRCALPLALCAVLLATAAPAIAQTDRPPPQVDLKPLLPPIIPPPLLPPNSTLTPGSVSGGTQSPYSSAPLYDPTQNQATPGLRLTIPTR